MSNRLVSVVCVLAVLSVGCVQTQKAPPGDGGAEDGRWKQQTTSLRVDLAVALPVAGRERYFRVRFDAEFEFDVARFVGPGEGRIRQFDRVALFVVELAMRYAFEGPQAIPKDVTIVECAPGEAPEDLHFFDREPQFALSPLTIRRRGQTPVVYEDGEPPSSTVWNDLTVASWPPFWHEANTRLGISGSLKLVPPRRGPR